MVVRLLRRRGAGSGRRAAGNEILREAGTGRLFTPPVPPPPETAENSQCVLTVEYRRILISVQVSSTLVEAYNQQF